MPKVAKRMKVTIGVLTYNHENYIEECLDSVISQSGSFDLRVIIVNDKSTDSTEKVIKSFIAKHKNVEIEYSPNKENIGVQKSIFRTLGLIKDTKSDYWSYIEGDDKYLSGERTQKHIDLLESHKGALGSYNKLLLIDEKSDVISKHEPEYLNKVMTTEQLAAQNHIGSFCATFYSSKCFKYFDIDEFEGLTVYDWFFNIWMSQYGEIRQLSEYLTGYRQHTASVWSSKSQADKYWELIWSIDSYNKKLAFKYDEAFQSYKRDLINQLTVIGSPMEVDIAVIGELFPNLSSRFIGGEIDYILENNENIAFITAANQSEKFKQAVRDYKVIHADIANKVIGYNGSYSVRAKCIYATSINDAYHSAEPVVNKYETALVFEIPLEDESKLGNVAVKKKLKSVFNSVNFTRVIAHSEAVKKYLIDNRFCPEEYILLIPSGISSKIYGEGNLYGEEQLKSYYFQINNILQQCAAGKLQPPPQNAMKKAKIYYHKARPVAIRKAKSLIRRNKVVLRVAKTVAKPVRSIYRSKGVK